MQGRPQPHFPQLSQTSVSKPSTTLHLTYLHNNHQDHDITAFNALSSVVSERAATAVPPYRPAQSLPPATLRKEPLPFGRDTVTTGAAHGQQLQDISKLTVNRAAVPADKNPFTLQQSNQNVSFAKPISKNDQAKASVSGSSDGLARRTSDGDIGMEDVPLGEYRNALNGHFFYLTD